MKQLPRDQIVYIARALDGSWCSPTPALTEIDAQAHIAAHEPDPSKHGDYQILAEPIGAVLAGMVPGVKRGIRHKLVKWDGDAPIPDDAADHPERYPQVSEVIEGGDGLANPKVTYRRS